ncbi:MAG TPA: hypothetical protein VKT32_13250, partial [Chthonomonadaceae bacterium]|nr:hypothetical protein [Chthonomonadaceae bacterium]
QNWNGAERVLVVPGWVWPDGPIVAATQIATLDTSGNRGAPIVLDHNVQMVTDLAADSKGNLFLLGSTNFLAGVSNQIFKFDPNGKLLTTLGSGTNRQAEDGSELTRAIAIDHQDNIYSFTYGQPYNVVRYSADLQTVTTRPGQFYWYEGWNRVNDQTPLRLDKNDRIWVGTIGDNDGASRWHFRPCVLRTVANFLTAGQPGVSTTKTYALGVYTSLDTKLPYNVSNTLGAQSFDFVVGAGYRQISGMNVNYRIYDVYKNLAASGQFSLSLQNYVEARQSIPFTPSKWGWYTCEFFMTDNQGRDLGGVGAHLGFTPAFANMPLLAAGESNGGFNDSLRQAFCGLMLDRVSVDGGPGGVENAVDQSARYGTTLIAQFTTVATATPEIVQAMVAQFKGRVKYWEILNEPNNGMSAQAYVALLKTLYPIIKQADPAAQVLGPTTVGIDLNWLQAFYKAGGQRYFDILSIHDYEGDESIDPVHWSWKMGQLRSLMSANGDAKKAIWQTERAITGVRFNTFLGGCQAARVTLHNDIMEALGVSPDHNLHYYLNNSGYVTEPSYLWDRVGPHPGALAMRTRKAMTLGLTYSGTFDFGPTGNKIFLGLLYTGGNGSTIVLRNLGTSDQSLTVKVQGGSGTLQVVDSFGNTQSVPVSNGKATLTVPILPIYVQLAPGQNIAMPKIDFGTNIASQASFVYSDKTQSNPKLLTDGILGNYHAGDPNYGMVWTGAITTPNPTLEMDFPSARTVSKLLVFSVRADNPHCTLLDYDLQAFNGKNWVTIDQVR